MEIIIKPDNTPWNTLEEYGYKDGDMIPMSSETAAKYLPTGLPVYAIAKDMKPVLIQHTFQLGDHLLPCVPIDSWNNYMQQIFSKNNNLKQDSYQGVPCATISVDDFEVLMRKNAIQMPFPVGSRVFVIEPIMQNQFTSSIVEGRVSGYSCKKAGTLMEIVFCNNEERVSHANFPVELANKSIFSTAIKAINGRETMAPCYSSNIYRYMERVGIDAKEYLPFSDAKQADAIRQFKKVDLYTINDNKEVVLLETDAESCAGPVFIKTSDWNDWMGSSLPCIENNYEREDE